MLVIGFNVTRAGERWEFRPTPDMVFGPFNGAAAVVLAISLFVILLLSGSVNISARIAFGLLCCAPAFLLAVALLAVGVKNWQFRDTPLIIESSGRILYGERQICTSGTIRRVVTVTCPKDDEAGESYRVTLETTGGEVVELPTPYFADLEFNDPKQADALAEQFAKALAVAIENRGERTASVI